jgi:ABC-type iron transport system FetAB ATPase subunit
MTKRLCLLSTKRRFWTVANVTLSGVGKPLGDVPVLHNVDLDIRDGECMVLVGPLGGGDVAFRKAWACAHAQG